MTKDRCTGLLALILGLWVAVSAYQLPNSKMPGDVGPKAFPYITAALLIICGAGLLITGKKKSERTYNREQLKRLGLVLGLLLAYIVAMNLIGFLIPTFIVTFLLCTMFARGKTNVVLWKRLLFAALLDGAVYAGFTLLLNMQLPQGILF